MGSSWKTSLKASPSGRLSYRERPTSGIKSSPTRSINANTPVDGIPNALPTSTSASSTRKPWFLAALVALLIHMVPRRLAIKPGVSLHRTTPFPRLTSQKVVSVSITSASTLSPATSSRSLMYLGGLKKCVIANRLARSAGMPSIRRARWIVDVFDVIIASGRATASTLRYRACFNSRRSIMTSIIRSQSANFSRSSSRLPGVTFFATRLCMKGAGLALSALLIAPCAKALRGPSSGTMSSSTTGKPALATCAAMPMPMTPDPITATFLISIVIPKSLNAND